MTILVPAACSATMMFSISCVAPGSRLAVGSSRNRTSGRSAHTRASASRCCSPPDSTRAACVRQRVEADLAQRLQRALLALLRAGRRRASAHRSRCRAPSGAAAPAAGTPSPGAAARPAAPARSTRSFPRSARAVRGTAAAARSCRRRSARGSPCAARRRVVSRDAVDDAAPADLEHDACRGAAAAATAGRACPSAVIRTAAAPSP